MFQTYYIPYLELKSKQPLLTEPPKRTSREFLYHVDLKVPLTRLHPQ